MNNERIASNLFQNGFNCAQAVVSAFSEQLGLDMETASRLASGFGAGMGRLQKTCGAVTGAYMVLGLKYGFGALDNRVASQELTYAAVRAFTEEFEKQNATTECRELVGVDFIHGDKETALTRVKTICPKMVKDAVDIVSRIIKS